MQVATTCILDAPAGIVEQAEPETLHRAIPELGQQFACFQRPIRVEQSSSATLPESSKLYREFNTIQPAKRQPLLGLRDLRAAPDLGRRTMTAASLALPSQATILACRAIKIIEFTHITRIYMRNSE